MSYKYRQKPENSKSPGKRWQTVAHSAMEEVANKLGPPINTGARVKALQDRKLANTKTSIHFGNYKSDYVRYHITLINLIILISIISLLISLLLLSLLILFLLLSSIISLLSLISHIIVTNLIILIIIQIVILRIIKEDVLVVKHQKKELHKKREMLI